MRYKSVYIYLATYFINAVLSFLTVSLLTHYIKEPYDYGIVNLYSEFLIFLMPFISCGVLYPLSVEYFKRPKETYSDFFTNAQALSIGSVILFTILCVAFQNQLSSFLKVPTSWIWILPIATWWIMINEIVMMIARNKNRPFQFAFFSIGKNLTEIMLTIILVIGLHWTWRGRLMSAVTAPVLIGFISIFLFFRWQLISKKIDAQTIRKIFLLSVPFIFERMAVFVLSNSDRYFINHFDLKGTKEVGLYGLGSQIASIIYMVIISLNSAYHPHLFKKLSEGFKEKFHRSTGLYIAACALAVGGIFIAIPILFRFFIGVNYQAAQPYAYILSAGYLFWAVYNAFLGYLLYLEKNRQIFFISVIGMITSLTLNIFMVRYFGARGAALTSGITYLVMAATCFFYVRKYYLKKR